MIWYGISIASVIYYSIIVTYAGLTAAFSPIWLVFAAGSVGVGTLAKWQHMGRIHLPKWLMIGSFVCFTTGILVFICIEALLIKGAVSTPTKNADYLIVLGAKVNQTTPSKTLRARVDRAVRYLNENPDTIAIVSGGQGPGEQITEAQAMYEQMVRQGIKKERILLEGQSVNTEENIRFSKRFIGSVDKKIVIATSDFHVFRGTRLAEKQGFTQVSGCPSRSDIRLVLHYYVREFFAVVKDGIKGSL